MPPSQAAGPQPPFNPPFSLQYSSTCVLGTHSPQLNPNHVGIVRQVSSGLQGFGVQLPTYCLPYSSQTFFNGSQCAHFIPGLGSNGIQAWVSGSQGSGSQSPNAPFFSQV